MYRLVVVSCLVGCMGCERASAQDVQARSEQVSPARVEADEGGVARSSAQVADVAEAAEIEPEVVERPEVPEPPAPPTRAELEERYVWLDTLEEGVGVTTLERAFPTPDGYRRVAAPAGSFAEYLRGLPMRTDRKDVHLYDGTPAPMPSAGIIPLDLGKRDLHQCADTVIRLHAEWLWSQGRAKEASYHFTSGDLAQWKRWRKGKVLKIKGRKVVEVSAKPSPNTHAAFRRWLDVVFMYASTRSMHRDSERVKEASTLAPGDFFLKGGSPGHVVVLLDVVENDRGERLALVGQGYLPARDVHVLSGGAVGAWYALPSDGDGTLATPTWAPFGMKDARRFE